MRIDYRKIADAVDFYSSRGYVLIETPWAVSDDAVEMTFFPPNEEKPTTEWGVLVGSAEQGFIQMMIEAKMPTGKYMSVSPCFRPGDDKKLDELHLPYFMKLELIHFPCNNPYEMGVMLRDAFDFFSQYVECDIVDMPDGSMDIVTKSGIELGSYGIRNVSDDFCWVYGTGVAEPRLSSQCKS